MQVKLEKGAAHTVCYTARDGKTLFHLMAYDAEGREYSHYYNFHDRDRADVLAKKVNDRGYINHDHWGCRVPYGSNAWLSDGMEDRLIEDEKNGYL